MKYLTPVVEKDYRLGHPYFSCNQITDRITAWSAFADSSKLTTSAQ